MSAAHQHRLAGLLELREAVALAGDEGRIGELGRPPVRCGHVAVRTDAHAGSDLHLLAPLSGRIGCLPCHNTTVVSNKTHRRSHAPNETAQSARIAVSL